MTGNVFNIQRFSTSDGPGIRTTVFFKGCPLSCIWCHNPESKMIKPEIFFDRSKCVLCGKCAEVCREKQHIFDGIKHIFSRDNCISCSECAAACPTDALEICGREMTSADVISEVLRDADFYKESGGGITLSGGEPLFQYDFALDILKKAKSAGIHTAIETSGYTGKSLNEISKYADLWLFDIKLFDESEHLRCTGVSNKLIFQNLFLLDSMGAKIVLRCPIIPEINLTPEHFHSLASLANRLKNISAIHLEPYHPLGIDKASRLGKTQKYKKSGFLSADGLTEFAQKLMAETNVKIEII